MFNGVFIGMHHYKIWIKIKTEYPKATKHPPKIALEWTVTRLRGQENELFKEAMRTITKKWYFDLTSGGVDKNFTHSTYSIIIINKIIAICERDKWLEKIHLSN